MFQTGYCMISVNEYKHVVFESAEEPYLQQSVLSKNTHQSETCEAVSDA